jgi:hypothetical protein
VTNGRYQRGTVRSTGPRRAADTIARATTCGSDTMKPGRSDCGKPSVLTKPGLSWVTVTPLRRHCSPTASLKPTSANLLAVYAGGPTPTLPATDAMLMTRAGAEANSRSANAAMQRTAPAKLTFMTADTTA